MRDRVGVILKVGQTVAYSFGWTTDAYLGVITAFTKKMVKVTDSNTGVNINKMPKNVIVCK